MTPDQYHTRRKSPFILPAAILLSVLIVGSSAFFLMQRKQAPVGEEGTPSAASTQIRAVERDDHILGNPNAPVVFVVYSDFECPFCKEFHTTMHRIIDEYGKDGSVAFVFRHMPLIQLHDKAPTQALASECVAKAGGNDAFWKFADELYRVTPSNNRFNLADLPAIAEQAGVDRVTFEACMRSDDLMRNVRRDFDEAVAAGAKGTPFTVLLAMGQQVKFGDAQPLAAMRAVTETALRQVQAEGRIIPPDEVVAPLPIPATATSAPQETLSDEPSGTVTTSSMEAAVPQDGALAPLP